MGTTTIIFNLNVSIAMKTRLFFLFLMLSFVILPNFSQAEPSMSDLGCDKAQSTSSTQQCLKGRLEQEQYRLSNVYDALDKHFDDETKQAELKELQKAWLNYRDQECMWEAEQATAPGLKGINELSCMTRLTSDRADLLEVTHMDVDPKVMRQYANVIRWKNLLGNEYADVIWDYKNTNEEDLTCNERSEIIVRGTKYNQTDMYEIAAQPLFEKQEIIAVIDNPKIGSPKANIFAFDIWDEVGDAAAQNMLCEGKLKLEFDITKTLNEETQELEVCESVIKIDNGKCTSRNIIWDGKEFSLSDREIKEQE